MTTGTAGLTPKAIDNMTSVRWVAIAVVLAATAILGALLLGGFPLDDSYITLHNARVLLEGEDPNYGVPALVGATSPVHLAVVACLGAILPLHLASILVGVGASIAYIAGVHHMAVALDLGKFNEIVLTVGSLAGFTMFQILNGVETGLAMAVVAWILALALQGPSLQLAFLIGVAPFVRPELAILSIGVSLYYIRSWTSRHWLTGAAAAAPLAIWLLTTTGSLIPGTAIAKEAYFAEGWFPLSYKLTHAAGHVAGSAFGLVLLAGLMGRGKLMAIARVYFAAVFVLMMMRFPNGLSHNHGRYLYVVLPAALLGIGYLMRQKYGQHVTLALLVWTLVTLPFAVDLYIEDTQEITSRNEGAVEWMTANLPPDSRLFVHDAGYLAWATDFELIDVVGLKTPSSVDAHRRWTVPSLGAERHRAISSIAAGATHAVILDRPGWSSIAEVLVESGLVVETVYGRPLGFYVYELTSDS